MKNRGIKMTKDIKILPNLGKVEYDFTEEFNSRNLVITKENISNVKLIKLITREDGRGLLLKDIQSFSLPKDKNGKPMFGEHYTIINPTPIIRGFHVHRELWDYFCIITGKAKFVLIDCRKLINGINNQTYGFINEFFLSERNPFTLVVPPGVYHGWKSYIPNTILSSTSTHLYDPNNLDEVRVPHTSFGYNWDIKIK